MPAATVTGHRKSQPKWVQQEDPCPALHPCSTREVGKSAAMGSPRQQQRSAGHSSLQLWASQAQEALSADHALSGRHAELCAPAAGRVLWFCNKAV